MSQKISTLALFLLGWGLCLPNQGNAVSCTSLEETACKQNSECQWSPELNPYCAPNDQGPVGCVAQRSENNCIAFSTSCVWHVGHCDIPTKKKDKK